MELTCTRVIPPKKQTIWRAHLTRIRCKETQKLFETGRCKRFGSIAKVATRKLANSMQRKLSNSCGPRQAIAWEN
jgi:hypothetical protein